MLESKRLPEDGLSYSLTFEKRGWNASGARSGTITLRHGNSVVAVSDAFSGGAFDSGHAGKSPMPKGTYIIRLDIRGTLSTAGVEAIPGLQGAYKLRPYYGIQEIPSAMVLAGLDGQYEWGTIRAALNETSGEKLQNYKGNYLHGKKRQGDYTHGCICERSEKMLRILKRLDFRQDPRITVQVTS